MHSVLHYESVKAHEAELIRLAQRERVGAPAPARRKARFDIRPFSKLRKRAPVVYLTRSTS
jgi:hypothetical protein